MVKLELMTRREKEAEERGKRVCFLYERARAENPVLKPHRLFRGIAKEMDLTEQSVRNIAIKNGLYTPKSKSV